MNKARAWTALASAVVILLLQPFAPVAKMQTAHHGIAFISEDGSTQTGEYGENFEDNWDSVQTFRLKKALNAPLKLYIDNHSSLYRPVFRDYAVEALNDWSEALHGRLRFVFTTRADNADLTLKWTSAFSDRYVAGMTDFTIGHADVEIKTFNIPDKDIKGNIMHEFGHALGISGHSTNGTDIMVASRRWHRNDPTYDPQLSAHDIKAIRVLYSNVWHQGEDLYQTHAQTVALKNESGSQVASSQ